MRELLINLALGAAGLAVLSIPVWLPRWSRWIDARRVRHDHERRENFPAVRFDDDRERLRR